MSLKGVLKKVFAATNVQWSGHGACATSLEDVLAAARVTDPAAVEHYRRWLPLERRQGEYFASLLLDHLSVGVQEDIRRERLSLLDVGCSCGHLVNRLRDRFPRCAVQGAELERVRVEVARRYYPRCRFRLADVTTLDERFDVVLTSNVLEHFSAPLEMLEQVVAPLARRYVVTLVPFEESPLSDGHLFTFTDVSFPARLGDLYLVSKTVIDCRPDGAECWPGEQILTVYQRSQ